MTAWCNNQLEEFEEDITSGMFRQAPEDLAEYLCEGVMQVCGGDTGFDLNANRKMEKNVPHTEL